MVERSFTLVLHSHLPWVLHHGRWPHGEDWLHEAAAETYLPLWKVLEARARGGQPLGITLGLTPVLSEQLAHPDCPREFTRYLANKLEAAREDRAYLTRTGEIDMASLAERWEVFYRSTLEDFRGPYGPNLVARFRRLEEQGAIEIITCAATHGYLPLLSSDAAADEQLRVAVATHRRHFGRAPRGIWLPECAYRPAGPWPSAVMERAEPLARTPRSRVGIESLLARHGLEFFFVDTHLVSGGRPLGVYADRFEALRHLARGEASEAPTTEHRPYLPYRVGPEARVSCFGRDPVTAMQVWSGEHGYPGDGGYLDFHKKRFPGGHRYWRVTHPKADLAEKQIYVPPSAAVRAPEHARHFVELLSRTLAQNTPAQAAPIACAMFDTELFGHWWFEGPHFLAEIIDQTAANAGARPVTPTAYLSHHPADHVISLAEGSWGDGGGHQVWLNPETRWTWEHVHQAEARFEQLLREAAPRPQDPLLDRLLAQAGRSLLLLEASDWQFLITTVAARDYAEQRVSEHTADFTRLAELAERRIQLGALNQTDETFLAECERRDGLFPDYDWRGHAAAGAPHAIIAS